MGTCFSSPKHEIWPMKESKAASKAPKPPVAVDLNAVSTLSISSDTSDARLAGPRVAPADISHIDIESLRRSTPSGNVYNPVELHTWEAVLVGRRLVTDGRTTARKRVYDFNVASRSLSRLQSNARTKKGKERAFIEWEREAVKMAQRQSEIDRCIPDVEVFDTRNLPKHWTVAGMSKRPVIHEDRLYIGVDEYGIVTGVGCG